jgi:hypothetical protein
VDASSRDLARKSFWDDTSNAWYGEDGIINVESKDLGATAVPASTLLCSVREPPSPCLTWVCVSRTKLVTRLHGIASWLQSWQDRPRAVGIHRRLRTLRRLILTLLSSYYPVGQGAMMSTRRHLPAILARPCSLPLRHKDSGEIIAKMPCY